MRLAIIKSGEILSRLWKLQKWRKEGKPNCLGSYIFDKHICQFLIVTGGSGKSTSGFLDSTEIFSDNVWRTVAAKLPALMSDMRVATINNRVLSFGD